MAKTKATETKIITLKNLSDYDKRIKTKMATDDSKVLSSAKSYADSLADNYDAKGTAETKVNELADGAVKTNSNAIAKLNGDDTVEGSVDKKIKDATTSLKSEISASAYDDTEIKNRVIAAENSLVTLTGTGEGSVHKSIVDEVAKIINGADESRDSFKELSDWIDSHTSDAATMNSQITTNKTDIEKLKEFVTHLPEGTEATTIIEYISEQLGVAKTELLTTIATSKTEAITEAGTNADTKIAAKVGDIGEGTVKDYVDAAKTAAITDAGTKADKALEDAKAYTDTLADRVSILEGNPTYIEATDEDIDALFPTLAE